MLVIQEFTVTAAAPMGDAIGRDWRLDNQLDDRITARRRIYGWRKTGGVYALSPWGD